MIARHRSVSKLMAAGSAAALASLVFAGVVAAHNASATFECNTDNLPVLHVDLNHYSDSITVKNIVVVKIDDQIVDQNDDFGTAYLKDFSGGSPFVSHDAEVIVTAGDDAQFDQDIKLTVDACQQPTPTPTATPTPTPTPPTPSPTGSVGGETGKPHITPPSTSTVIDGSASSGGALQLILVGLIGFVVVSIALLPRDRTARQKARRD